MEAGDRSRRHHLLGVICSAVVLGSLVGPVQALAGGTLTANPPAVNFGDIAVGSTSAVNVTLTNTTPNLIGNDSIVGANASEFATNSACDGQSPSNANPCTLQVSFSPTSLGMKSATLNIPNNGTNPNVQVPLSGTGVAPTQPLLVPVIPTEDPACAALRAKLKKAKKKKQRRKIRRQLRNLGC